jgi:phage gp36-like protein
MDNKIDRELLQQLHDEINNTQTVDEKGSELLRDLEGDIRALLERSEEHPLQVHPSIIQRLENALDHYEVTHPELTTLISKVLDSLSNAGI